MPEKDRKRPAKCSRACRVINWCECSVVSVIKTTLSHKRTMLLESDPQYGTVITESDTIQEINRYMIKFLPSHVNILHTQCDMPFITLTYPESKYFYRHSTAKSVGCNRKLP